MQKHILALIVSLTFVLPVTVMAVTGQEKCAQLTASGEAELDKGNLVAANKSLQEAVQVCDQSNAKSARPYIAYGKLLFEREKWRDAVKWFKRALEDQPGLQLAYMDLSAAYIQMRDYGNAIDYGIKAVELSGDDESIAESAYNVGLAYVNQGADTGDVEYAKKAEPYFLKTAKYMPAYNQTYYQLGAIKEAAYSDFKSAAEYYSKSCEMGYTPACSANDSLRNRIKQSNAQPTASSSSNEVESPPKKKKKH